MKMTMSPPSGEDLTMLPLHDSNTNNSSDHSSHFDDESIGEASTATPNAGNEEEEAALAEPETIAVRILKAFTLLVLVGATVLVSVYVFLYMKRDEEDALEENFNRLAQRLINGFHQNAALRVQTLDMFGISLTASALATNQTWPYCTFDDFEARATAARVIAKSEFVGMYPYVTNETKKEWEFYTTQNTHWINDSFAFQEDFKSVHNRTVGSRAPARALRGMPDGEAESLSRWLMEQGQQEPLDDDTTSTGVRNVTFDGPDGIPMELYRYGTEEEGFLFVYEDGPGPYYPMWQVSPTREYSAIDVNYNIADDYYSGAFAEAPEAVRTTQTAIFGGVWNVDEDGYIAEDDDYDFRTVPAASLIYPIFDKLTGDKEVVAVLDLDIEFGPLFSSVLPENSNKLLCVVQSTCNQVYSYEVTGETATYLGAEDLHDERFDHMMVSALLTDFDQDASTIYNGPAINKDFCPWVISVYATQDLEDAYITSGPIYYMLGCLGIFLFTCLVFCSYDCLVEHRQRKVSTAARRSEKIVSSLFPKNFRDKLYENDKQKNKIKAQDKTPKSFQTSHVQDYLAEGNNNNGQLAVPPPASNDILSSPPMAELYPNCTVFFADVAGFTAWSSARSPTEVFTLLETIYGAFDKLAAKYKIFKIETIGDCYVAVTGLPVAQPGHALQMVRFSQQVHIKMKKLTQQLESTLGPDTSGLAMRVGLHSGPVTAGVLRGEKARFQLFGDTVNTAARMESNGLREQIHVSQQTADILVLQGKGHWVHAREEKIHAKGKGELQTYFVRPTQGAGSVVSAVSSSDASSNWDNLEDAADVELALTSFGGTEKHKATWAQSNYRRIGWVSDLLREELKKVLSDRKGRVDPKTWKEAGISFQLSQDYVWNDEIYKSLLSPQSTTAQDLSEDVERQVFEFVSQVAYAHQDVPYHSFEHACVVLMSVDKMLKQIRTLAGFDLDLSPHAKLACLVAALIRNMDPPAVPDFGAPGNMAASKTKSSSNLTSTTKAMQLLQDNRFQELRAALCATKPELHRFWNLTQNLVLATDSSGGILSARRNRRWEEVFGHAMHHSKSNASTEEKVVPVLEHIVLMASESHAVQHWENYVKWNDLLLREHTEQYHQGRLSTDPTPTWHQTQMTYFDQFMIPLTQKIDQAGVLGAIGGEFYMYACQNRQELASGMGGNQEPAPAPPRQLASNQFRPVPVGTNTFAAASIPGAGPNAFAAANTSPSPSFSNAAGKPFDESQYEDIVEV